MNTRRTTTWVVVLTGIGSLMAALDTLVVAAALSTIRLDLGASVEQLEWTVNAYNLAFAVLLLPAAALGDRFGRRRLFAAGLTIFALASAACALAPEVGWLIAARAVQGAGAALVMSLGLGLLSAAFPPERRGAALGIFSAITGLSVASGPLIGGAVVEGLAWQWVFWINVPIGLVAAPLVMSKLRESFGPDTTLDLPGLGLVTTRVLGIVWGLVRSSQAGWGSTEVVATLTLGALLLAGFIWWEARAPQPMLPLRLFRARGFSAGSGVTFLLVGGLFISVFFYAQLLQTGLGYGPLATGLRLIPWTITFLTVAPIAGVLSDRIGERPLIVCGMTLQAIGMLWIALIADPSLSYGAMIAPLVIGGVGVSMTFPAAQNAVVGGVSMGDVGRAAGSASMMRELGGVFGIAVAVAVFAAAGGYATPSQFTDGFAPATAVGAGLALLGALAGLALPGRRQTPVVIPAAPVPASEGASR
jgi:EmrB/QacA subfamily drug resistance transporter